MKTRNESGALYGKENFFFGNMPQNFKNYIWIELIGFDKDNIEKTVKDFLDKTGFKPQGVLYLVSSIDIINNHREGDYTLDPYFCSYVGHKFNDERELQNWTKTDLTNLNREFKKYGVESFVSIFDYRTKDSENQFPEIGAHYYEDGVIKEGTNVYMTKKVFDGRLYEDIFLEKTLKFLEDSEFSGIHLADGIVRPRLPLQWTDYSPDMLSQAGILVPDGENPAEYIRKNKRKEWIDFNKKRWASFLKKVVCGIKEKGYKVVANNSWTKDPLEALYRFGTSYKDMDKLPFDGIVTENGAATLSILDNEANSGYKQSYEERKEILHSLRAALLLNSACMRNLSLSPLFPVRDTMEQYDIIHHMPTLIQRHASEMFSTFVWKNGKLSNAISGHTFCLSDGLTKDNWTYLRLSNDNGYVGEFSEVKGATVIWSDERNEAELSGLINHRQPSTHHILTKLLRRGASIFKSAHIEDLEIVKGDILVTNPELMPKGELEKVKNYKKGRVIYFSGKPSDEDFSTEMNPKGLGFPYPLYYNELPEDELKNCVEEINQNLAYLKTYVDECRVQEIKISENKSRFIILNDEYFYTRPVLETKREIKSVTDITKYEGYNVSVNGTTFRTLVPLRGAVILEVEF